jgi:hypothetical protein
MVQLNTSKNINPIIPIVLLAKGFHVEPDWIRDRDEVTDSYKRFYSHVARRIGKRGYAYLSIEGLAKDLRLCTRTITRHIRTSVELGLMEITATGRSHRFVIVWHPWMSITEEQAKLKAVKTSLPDKMSDQTRQFVQGLSPQAQENQVDSNGSKSLETILIEPNKEIRGHAQPASNITNSGIPDSTTKSEETSDESERNFRTETSIEEIEPKGKFSLEIYLDFAKSEQLQKKNIKNINRFAEWLLIEGKQDNEVSKFVEAKKENLIGARTIDGAKSETRPSPVAPVVPAAPAAPTTRASKEEIAEVKQLLAIESLGVAAWESLEQTKQNKLFESVKAEVAKNPVCSKLTKEGLETHIIGIIKEKLGKWAYKANVSDCGGILERIGKEIFEGLDDDLQGELVGEKIELAGDEFYLSDKQGKLMQDISNEIYLELGIGEVGKI